jgi:hypothetical protein
VSGTAQGDAGRRGAEPLRVSFTVACSPEHAFRTWTSEITRWWPPDHTMTGNPATIVLEGRAAGRIFERSLDGTEHDWGEVRTWQPPDLLEYSWHLGRGRDRATLVRVRFLPDEAGTRVEIEHSGWDAVTGSDGWYERTGTSWTSLYPHFIRHTEEGMHRWQTGPRTTPGH